MNTSSDRDQRAFSQGASCLILSLGVLIVQPIWYYLLYQILSRLNATTAMWAAYWVYAPAGIVFGLFAAIIQSKKGN